MNNRKSTYVKDCKVVVGEGFEPSNSERADLQSAAFNHFAIPPVFKDQRKYPKTAGCLS